MPIEFRCTSCNKLLRTADETAGKQAKCPQCGTVVDIPHPSQPAPPPASFGEPLGNIPSPGLPGGREPASTPFGPASTMNPYQSPLTAPDAYSAPSSGPRSGPPWERNRPSFGSFVDTVKLLYSQLPFFFLDMRREGGIGAPLGFGVIGGMIGVIAVFLTNLVLQGVFGMALGGFNQIGVMAGVGAASLAMALACYPVLLVISLLLSAGICHLMLMILGGAKYPYETTFRAIAYSFGGAYLLAAIPICGGYIALVVVIVFSIFGVMNAHETSGWKATGAVLIPAILCACAGVVLVAAAIASIAANVPNAGMQ